MSKSIIEFTKFLSEYSNSMTELELKLASIILESFDDVESKSSAGGARASKISSLIVSRGKSALPYVTSIVEGNSAKPKIKNLSKLSVKGFRGFNGSKDFDLSKKFTFLFGLNGTGKSSFCEALEYSLTGKINEASSKRFESGQYVSNVLSQDSNVTLTAAYDDGSFGEAVPDPLGNEFLFIERNRIEAFARVSSYAPQGQQQRLSALFGLEDFNSFCNGFNKTIEQKLPLIAIKENELKVKEQQVEKSKLVIDNKNEELNLYNERKNTLLSKYPQKKLVSEVLDLLASDVDGLILKKNTEIESLSKKIFKPVNKAEEVLKSLVLLPSQLLAFNKLVEEVNKYKDELNYVDLYSAVKKISLGHEDFCPACDTPFTQVAKNPFLKADEQLKALEVISKKQKLLLENRKLLSDSLIKISSELKVFEISCFLTIESLAEKYESIKFYLEEYIVKCNKLNIENKEEITKVARYKEELKALESDHRECSIITELYTAAYKERGKAEKIISNFLVENKKLISLVEDEQKLIAHYHSYSEAYETFISKLKSYAETLPLKLAKSLELQVVELYNAINKHPYDHEILESISLPTKPNNGIKIKYLDGTTEDALRVLSEGHLRCLGLSILLAKNIHDDHSVIIFDDVVNAIDDEHRSGIINELFSNNLLSEKQMIITTHGEDFIKRLENQFSSKGLNNKLTRYDFLRNNDSRDLLIASSLNRHYLVKAKNNLSKGFVKDCLMECRRSLEELTPRLWKKMRNEGLDPAITVKLRAPLSSPDLYNLIDGLNAYIAEIEKKPGIKNFSKHRECLLKVKNSSKKNPITWNLLNKGVHEEDRDEEFDENQARELFELCLEFEGLIKNYSSAEFKISAIS